MSLTDEGARLLERCRRVLADFAELEAGGPRRAARAADGDRAGAVRAAARAADRARVSGRPSRAVDVRLVLLDRVVALAEEGVDLAVRIGGLPDSSLRSRLVGHVRLVVCASPAYLRRRGTPREPARPGQTRLHRLSSAPRRCPSAGPSPAGAGANGASSCARAWWSTPGRPPSTPRWPGWGWRACCRTRSTSWWPASGCGSCSPTTSRPPAPIHIVQLPGAQVRAATAFADLAVERLRARFGVRALTPKDFSKKCRSRESCTSEKERGSRSGGSSSLVFFSRPAEPLTNSDPDDPPSFNASQGYSSDLDVNQAFNFNSDGDRAVGFMHSLALGSTTLSPDLIVHDPMDASRTATVAAVLERVSWNGGAGDAIDFTMRLSGSNKESVIAAVGESVRDVSFSFTVYERIGSYFEAFHTAGQVLPALIGVDGPDQKIFVNIDPNTDLTTPENFTVLLTLVPGSERRVSTADTIVTGESS